MRENETRKGGRYIMREGGREVKGEWKEGEREIRENGRKEGGRAGRRRERRGRDGK